MCQLMIVSHISLKSGENLLLKFSTKAVLTVCLGTFPFDRLTEVKTEDLAMASLVISEETNDMVQAVCHAQNHPFQVEYIWSKGEGQIILLHGRVCPLLGKRESNTDIGPPGVGKTYTVGQSVLHLFALPETTTLEHPPLFGQ